MGGKGPPFDAAGVTIAAVVLAPLLLILAALQGADPYPVYVWRFGGPRAGPEWAAAIRKLGFTGTNVEGAEDPARFADLQLPFYADHLVDRAVFHRDHDDPAWTAARGSYKSTASTAALQRNPSLADGAILSKIRETAAVRAARAGAAGAQFLSVADEPSFTAGLAPFDYDRSPAALESFRTFLQSRFPSVGDLSRAFARAWTRWNEVIAPTTNEVLAREWQHGAPWNFSDWTASRNHSDALFAEALGAAIGAARQAAPGKRVGFLGGLAPSAFGGYNWNRILALRPDVLEVYDAGAARDLVRTMAPSVELVDTTFLTDSFSQYPPALAPARLSWLFARGGRRAVAWANVALFDGEDSARPTAAARDLSARVASLRTLATKLEGSRPDFDPIGIVYSHASIQLGWLLDSRGDGARWIERLTSYELQHSTALASLEGWFRLCEDLGYSPRAIALDPAATRPALLILPRCLALSAQEVSVVRAWAAKGTSVIAEGRPALFDADLVGGGPSGALDDLFALRPHPFRGLQDANCQFTDGPGLTVLEPGLEAGNPRRYGPWIVHGHAMLCNISMASYRDDRLEPGNPRAFAVRRALADWFEMLGCPVKFVAWSIPRIPLSIHREVSPNGDVFLFVVSNVRRNPRLAQLANGPVRAFLTAAARSSPGAVLHIERIDGESPSDTQTTAGTEVEFLLDPLHFACFKIRTGIRRRARTPRRVVN
jgi:hypothetical protein